MPALGWRRSKEQLDFRINDSKFSASDQGAAGQQLSNAGTLLGQYSSGKETLNKPTAVQARGGEGSNSMKLRRSSQSSTPRAVTTSRACTSELSNMLRSLSPFRNMSKTDNQRLKQFKEPAGVDGTVVDPSSLTSSFAKGTFERRQLSVLDACSTASSRSTSCNGGVPTRTALRGSGGLRSGKYEGHSSSGGADSGVSSFASPKVGGGEAPSSSSRTSAPGASGRFRRCSTPNSKSQFNGQQPGLFSSVLASSSVLLGPSDSPKSKFSVPNDFHTSRHSILASRTPDSSNGGYSRPSAHDPSSCQTFCNIEKQQPKVSALISSASSTRYSDPGHPRAPDAAAVAPSLPANADTHSKRFSELMRLFAGSSSVSSAYPAEPATASSLLFASENGRVRDAYAKPVDGSRDLMGYVQQLLQANQGQQAVVDSALYADVVATVRCHPAQQLVPHKIQDNGQPTRIIAPVHCPEGFELTDNLPGYWLGPIIGEGGFCKVHMGLHQLSGSKVAVKVLDQQKLADEKEQKRIQREIRVLKHLNHECVIKLFDVVEVDQKLFIIMEFAPAGSLLDYVREKKRLPEAEACFLLQQIVAGLQYCHEQEVVHRDIKLENILLDSNNNVKIIDFGLSAFFAPGKTLKVHCGSPSYAAPEIVARKTYEGPPVDVWSLGVVLFAMLCGYLPFHSSSGNKQELCSKIMSGVYTVPDWLSHSARDLLSRMLTLDPDQRITLAATWQHPWVRSSPFKWSSTGQSSYLPRKNSISGDYIFSEEVLQHLESMGLSKNLTVKHLVDCDCNYYTTSYVLLEQKLRSLQVC